MYNANAKMKSPKMKLSYIIISFTTFNFCCSTFSFIDEMFLKNSELSLFSCFYNFFRSEQNHRALGAYINNNYKTAMKNL